MHEVFSYFVWGRQRKSMLTYADATLYGAGRGRVPCASRLPLRSLPRGFRYAGAVQRGPRACRELASRRCAILTKTKTKKCLWNRIFIARVANSLPFAHQHYCRFTPVESALTQRGARALRFFFLLFHARRELASPRRRYGGQGVWN